MFSVLFPGQGSQSVGMAKELHNNFDYVKKLFDEAEDTLNVSMRKLIFEWPKELLDQSENTQPAIFLVSYSIFNVIKNETTLYKGLLSYLILNQIISLCTNHF